MPCDTLKEQSVMALGAEEPINVAIWHALNNYMFSDATFLSERLYAEVGSDEVLHLLATCHYRSGYPKRAHYLLQKHGSSNSHCKYLMAKCCFELNNLAEAESILLGTSCVIFGSKVIDNIVLEYGNIAGFVLHLLGHIYKKSEQNFKAAECYRASLKSNPFLWSSFEGLCHIGEKVDAQDFFKTSTASKSGTFSFGISLSSNSSLTRTQSVSLDSRAKFQNDSPSENLDPSQNNSLGPLPLTTSTVVSKLPPNMAVKNTTRSSYELEMPTHHTMAVQTNTNRPEGRSRVGRNLLGTTATNSPLTPSFGLLSQDTPPADVTPSPIPMSDKMALKAPTKKTSRKVEVRSTRSSHFTGIGPGPSRSGSLTSPLLTPSPQGNVSSLNAGLRRSSRLFGSNSGSPTTKETKRSSKVHFVEPAKPSMNTRKNKLTRRARSSAPQPLTPTTENIIHSSTTQSPLVQQQTKHEKKDQKLSLSPIPSSTDGLMHLLQDLGKAYVALTSYECRKAISLFESLPQHQFVTCWVLQQVGTAYFEVADFHLAENAFEELRRIDPYHVEGMIVYSTLLWFLRKEGALSSLAHDLVEQDKLSAKAWCVMGNSFSLQKEHDTAIKFIQRSIQINPDLTYAYTLLGHEYVVTEELDKAMACFRNAIRLDQRHYNAWYGIAMIYYKQEKYALAERHFLRAVEINSKNSVLFCHLAVTQHAMQRSEEALKTVNKAISLSPKNALCKYHKSSFLFLLDRLEEAICELEELRKIAPRESLVYFLLGKIYRKLGQPHTAQMNFSWAMSLDPQGANSVIKESRYIPDAEDLNMSSEEIEEEDLDMIDQIDDERPEEQDELNSSGSASL